MANIFFSEAANAFSNQYLTSNLQISVSSGKTLAAPTKTKYMQLWHGACQTQHLESTAL